MISRTTSLTSSKYTSPRNNYQLKFTKSIPKDVKQRLSTAKYNHLKRFPNQLLFTKDAKKLDISCHCSDCGQMTLFQQKVWKRIPFFETAKKRVFRRFRVAGFAAQFLVFYKSEQIIKHKRQRQLQQFLRNPVINIKRGTYIQSAHTIRAPKSSPLTISDKMIRSNATDLYEMDSVKDSQFQILNFQLPQHASTKKRPLSIYMEKMLKNITLKQQTVHLAPLSLMNKRMQHKQHNKTNPCITPQMSPQHSSQQISRLQSILAPFSFCQFKAKSLSQKSHTMHNEYSNGNKDVEKQIDFLKKIKYKSFRKQN